VAHAASTGRDEAVWDLLADVARWAWCRPTFEILDWATPVPSAPVWPAAAVEADVLCARRGFSLTGDLGVFADRLAAIPQHSAGNPALAVARAWAAAFGGRIDQGRAALEDARPRSGFEHRAVRLHHVFIANFSVYLGLAGPGDVAAELADAEAVVAEIRRTGTRSSSRSPWRWVRCWRSRRRGAWRGPRPRRRHPSRTRSRRGPAPPSRRSGRAGPARRPSLRGARPRPLAQVLSS
jgi:hypothetical protein